jgi:hypothetical protein
MLHAQLWQAEKLVKTLELPLKGAMTPQMPP